MAFDFGDVLKAIGPNASIVFAAWIFMGFLQSRNDAAIARYREMVDAYRSGGLAEDHAANVKDQVVVMRRRCELMAFASMTGLISAILLILTLICGALGAMMKGVAAFGYVGAGSAVLGFALVIAATVLVLIEARISRRQLDNEMLDVPDLARGTGQEPGKVSGA